MLNFLNIPSDTFSLKIVIILAVGFTLSALLGYLSNKLKLSPLLGYLLAGYIIGPYFPGYVADMAISEQLAEIGVVLMLFGVGLHFKWHELLNVKNIAVPGAFGQTFITILITTLLLYTMGWSIEAGIICGLALGVASTVVLIRLLTDTNLLQTEEGHISVGWLIVEDIITVIALLLVPALALSSQGGALVFQDLALPISWALLKFLLLIVILFTLGRKCIKYLLSKILHTRSSELFVLTTLAIIFIIATASAILFGVSIALGAFLAGMLIGQAAPRHLVATKTLPLKDFFVVIFFLSIGMLFNPSAIGQNILLFIIVLAIILIVKPLIAFLIVVLLKQPLKIALTVAIALAQIGEFSFILAEEATRYKILPRLGYDIIVACSIISIALNPLLFKLLKFKKQTIS